MPDIDFLLLGTLEMRVGPKTFRIAGKRQRVLVACLLLARGRPIPTKDLVQTIYGAEAGQSAVHSLHELVSSLRRSLAPMGLDELLRSAAASYWFDLDPPQLDAWRFENLLGRANAEEDPRLRGDLFR